MSQDHGAVVRLSYRKIRDVSTPEEEKNSAATYFAVVPAPEILKIGTEGNLRSYIPAHPGKKRSLVHKAIGETIANKPDRFSQFNSGFLVGASKVVVDDQKKIVTLWDASINNGAQSQGEVDLYFTQCKETDAEPNDFNVRVEISVEPDAPTRTEIAIARNTTTRIQDLSQAGKRGYFDEIDTEFQKLHPRYKLARSETDIGDEFINTRLLLQVLWAMMPDALMPEGRTSIEARMKAYKNAAQCLADFEHAYLKRNSGGTDAGRYRYFCDMAGEAWRVYTHWRSHSAWEGQYLRADAKQIRRKSGEIVVADGLVFPALAALSNFVKKNEGSGKWQMTVPGVFREEHLVEAARRQLKQHSGKPMLMGRSGAAYEALMLLTEMANQYANA
ncbi:MAG: AIPR family protein [Alphaproteobacteria bacterium]|nr:AIPR family protein [Alphaproteobacteria bacterium]